MIAVYVTLSYRNSCLVMWVSLWPLFLGGASTTSSMKSEWRPTTCSGWGGPPPYSTSTQLMTVSTLQSHDFILMAKRWFVIFQDIAILQGFFFAIKIFLIKWHNLNALLIHEVGFLIYYLLINYLIYSVCISSLLMVFLLVLKMNLFFSHYFSVPVAVPNMVWVEAYNSTALMVHWTPVPNTRDSMKGRLRGYKVNDCPLFLPYM